MIGSSKSPLKTLLMMLGGSTQQSGFFARLFQSHGRALPEGLTPEHCFLRDGTHDPRRCKECIEIDALIGRIPHIKDISNVAFERRYQFGKNSKAIGKGASSVVRLAVEVCTAKMVAVKEFRKRRKSETLELYLTRLTDEFCIAQRLCHSNIVKTVDIVRSHHRWYEVMEYCEAGDMFTMIRKRSFSEDEINCIFRQVVEGVRYLHSHGIAHRDLKLENLLVDAQGTVKIGDFGVSQVFRANEWDPDLKTHGVCGSIPYIAPEEFSGLEYDARRVDVWSLGIIYFALTFHAVPWRSAHKNDPNFCKYLAGGMAALEPFQRIANGPRSLMKRLLEPDPSRRCTIDDVYDDPWFCRLKLCKLIMDGEEGPDVDDGSRYEYQPHQMPTRL